MLSSLQDYTDKQGVQNTTLMLLSYKMESSGLWPKR